MEIVVALRGAVAVAGRFPVLAGADLDVARSEILLLQGPNGAGKTSLLRALAGLLPIERGQANVLGVDVVRAREDVRNKVGLLGHTNGLYLDLSVRQNVGFWGAMVGAGEDEIHSAMDRMKLSQRLSDVKASQLSAGQRRRCALAALIVRRAQLWLLDEPHAGLDATSRDELDDTLRQAVVSGATVILASHEHERASKLASRIVTVDGGTVHNGILNDGTSQDHTS
jgi:heme ABC exporter ATP-binding subunit CcmA